MLAFSEPVAEVIRRRTSQRAYLPDRLSDAHRGALEGAIAGLGDAPFASRARFVLVEGAAISGEDLRRFGTYGFIAGAHSFLLGAVREGPGAMVDFGFLFEQLVLKATELGLATCWLGGTLRRGAIGGFLDAAEDELVPAMSPIGYPPERRALRDRIVRWGAGSDGRKPAHELFFAGDLDHPLELAAVPALAGPLEAVRRAPSASNRQPWRVVHDAATGACHFLLRRTRGYAALVKGIDLQRIDLGIALAHFALCAAEAGLPGRLLALAEAPLPLPARTEYVASWIA